MIFSSKQAPHNEPIRPGDSPKPVSHTSRRSDIKATLFKPFYAPGNRAEVEFDVLRNYDTIIVLDNSATMAHHRISVKFIVQAISSLPVIKTQGLRFILSSEPKTGFKGDLDQISYSGHSKVPTCVNELIRDLCLHRKEIGPTNYIIITDGAFDKESRRNTRSSLATIAPYARKLGNGMNKIGFQFVQVGDSEQAKNWLTSLDDDFSGSQIGGFVDTIRPECCDPLDVRDLMKIMLGGIWSRVDSLGATGVYRLPFVRGKRSLGPL